jgi:hypothetical protein
LTGNGVCWRRARNSRSIWTPHSWNVSILLSNSWQSSEND